MAENNFKIGDNVRNILSRKSGKIVSFISDHSFGDFADVEFEDGIAGSELKNLEKIPEESGYVQHKGGVKIEGKFTRIESEKFDLINYEDAERILKDVSRLYVENYASWTFEDIIKETIAQARETANKKR